MHALPSLRLVANLNSLLRGAQSIGRAERGVRGRDVAHHVVDPGDYLRIDSLHAFPLDQSFEPLAEIETESWFLGLPRPGGLAPLRGPAEFNRSALDQGEAVVAASAGIGLVPFRIGSAVQWRIFPAERPFAPETPYEAERLLNETLLAAAHSLARLDVAAGVRPGTSSEVDLAPGYPRRQVRSADRAARLLAICDLALIDDGASISSFEADTRAAEIRRLRAAAQTALVSAASWLT